MDALKKWNVCNWDRKRADELADELGISGELAGILWNREIRTREAAEAFLYPGEKQQFYDPFLMKGMKKAVERIVSAIREGENIVVYGDYDVDGITATSLLVYALRRLGAKVSYYIPDRQKEGYGFNAAALRGLKERGGELLVSVDCGIASVDEVAELSGELDIVITDHHLPGERIPDALAVIDPHQEDCPYPDKNLAGVGVAFKLCQALWRRWKNEDFADALEFVALGTVADIVPLVGENRKLVKLGLERMPHTAFPGLQALIEVSSLQGREINAGSVGFVLAPRLNAAGRIGDAREGVGLLLSESRDAADVIAMELNESNSIRQDIEKKILALAETQMDRMNTAEMHSIVLDGDGWHPGVIGIVASRLVDKYYLPTIIISRQGSVGKGSCRSIRGLHMYDALCACEKHLLGFGGHSQAAGLTIASDCIEAFRQAFDSYVAKTLRESDYTPSVNIEFELPPQEIRPAFVEELSLLEPYGMGNPKPMFACRGVRGRNARLIGRERQHLAFDLGTEAHPATALSWNRGAYLGIVNEETIDIVYTLQINEWQGRRTVEMVLQELGVAENERVFPERDLLVKIYSFLKRMQAGQGAIPMDDCALAVEFSGYFGHISLYSMKLGLQIFQELGLLCRDHEKKQYRLPAPKGKMDLLQSPSYRKHAEK